MWEGYVPIFRLLDDTGRDWGTERIWQRREMLIAIVDPSGCESCEALERALRDADSRGDWLRENAGLVLVSPKGDAQQTRIVDSLYEAMASFSVTRGSATLAVADRFGRLHAAVDVEGADVEQVLELAYTSIAFIQEQCDECGVPIEEPHMAPLGDSADDGLG